MQEKIERLKIQVGVIIFAQLIILGVIAYFDLRFVVVATIVLIIEGVLLFYVITSYDKEANQKIISISRILGSDAKDAFLFGEIGLVTYDDNINITWMSELFEEREIQLIGEKVTSWLPETSVLFQGDQDRIIVEYDECFYEITRRSDAQILFFKDVTNEHDLEISYENEKVVLGMIHLDNYEETTQYEEEQTISFIDSQIKQPIVDWAKKHGMFIRRVKADRYLVVLNERIYSAIAEERFSILNHTRTQSQENDISITLSMAFARGTDDFSKLDEMVNGLLELAQSRGGDQVAIKKYGEDVKYFGGRSEALEKRSRVRVRVMAQTLRDLIQKSSRVIIVGHKNMDFDCMGSALGMSRIVATYQKPVSIVCLTGGIEEKLTGALAKYQDILETRHDFINQEEALEMLDEDTLVIMVDHHNVEQSNSGELIGKANKVVVVDHHRRQSDFTFNPVMVYIETSASSVSELVTEFFPYQITRVDVAAEEATIMFTGILIDTLRFKNRTGYRTFEAAAELKKHGADPIESDNLLKDDYQEFELKTSIMKYSERRDHNIIVTPFYESKVISRAMLSQVADSTLEIQGVEATFVIAYVKENQVAISARSTGKINVQVIMERMQGGGHFTAAALQRDGTSIEAVVEELNKTLEDYFKEDTEDESNIT